MNRRASGVAVIALVALLAILILSGLPAAPRAITAPASPMAVLAPHAASPSAARPSVVASLPPHPNVPCPPFYPGWGTIGGLWPIAPLQSPQGPCPWTGTDESHVSYFSNQPGSGQNVKIPLYLPADGPSLVSSLYNSLYIGMVLRGDPNSVSFQSYAEVTFTPTGSGASLSYSVELALWSLVNASFFKAGGCPSLSINFTWNGVYYCELDEMAGGNGVPIESVPHATALNVTFDGQFAGGGATRLWVNDSTTPSDSFNWTYNATKDNANSTSLTGNWSFEPYYGSSCVAACVLNWSMPFGLGFGANLCPNGPSPFSPCDSYNQFSWIGNNPILLGSPEYWNGSAYAGDYLNIAPESASGVCNTNIAPGSVVSCFNFAQNGGTGYYPIFTFNGSALNWGTNYSWTTQTFGGITGQYLSSGYPNELVPFFVDEVTNNSLAGFAPPSQAINVSARAQDLGSVSGVTLRYRVGTGAWTTEPMSRISGTVSNGIYNATIPGTGGNGVIQYGVNASSGAGVQIGSPLSSVERGPLPTFPVLLKTQPSTCGAIYLNGTRYSDGTLLNLKPGFYALQGAPCYPSIFFGWTLSPGLAVLNPSNQYGTLAVSANGTVTGVWQYVRPHDTILIQTNPSTCGRVMLNGSAYANNNTASLLDQLNYTLAVASACPQDASFAGWTFTGNFSILSGTFTPMGNGTLVANFVPSASAYPIFFYTAPTTCGGVLYRGAGYANGDNLSVLPGSYAISGDPCAHFGFRNFSTGGGVSVNGGTVTVTSSGWVRETNYHLTEITMATNPASCGAISFDGASYANGKVVVVQNNSTHTIGESPCPNYSFLGWNTSGGLHVFGNVLIANGSGTLLAVFIPGVNQYFVGFVTDPPGCGTVFFSGLTFHNSNYTFVAPGTAAPISASACANYGFVRWITTGGITVAGGTAYVNQSGSIEAVFRPLVPILLYTIPSGCGSITLNGVVYTDNSSTTLPIDASYTLGATPCAHYGFAGWLNSTSAIITGNVVFFVASSVLTAQFVLMKYEVSVHVDPFDCGGVRIGTTFASNGTNLTLPYGTYNYASAPCQGSKLISLTTTGNLSVVGSKVLVNGSGSLWAVFRPVPPSVVLNALSSSYAGQAVQFLATIGVPVPPFRGHSYSFNWNFGDGSASEVTPVNFTSHAFSSPGIYQVTVTVTDPYNRTATANESVSIVASSALAASGVNLTTVGALALVIVLFVLALYAGRWYARRRPPAEPEPAIAGPSALEIDEPGADAIEGPPDATPTGPQP